VIEGTTGTPGPRALEPPRPRRQGQESKAIATDCGSSTCVKRRTTSTPGPSADRRIHNTSSRSRRRGIIICNRPMPQPAAEHSAREGYEIPAELDAPRSPRRDRYDRAPHRTTRCTGSNVPHASTLHEPRASMQQQLLNSINLLACRALAFQCCDCT
jgi:hypothetical protein